MMGNVFELVADWFAEDYYSISPYNNPLGPEAGFFKVLRGGSWDLDRYDVRVADRMGTGGGGADGGFRCAGAPGK